MLPGKEHPRLSFGLHMHNTLTYMDILTQTCTRAHTHTQGKNSAPSTLPPPLFPYFSLPLHSLPQKTLWQKTVLVHISLHWSAVFERCDFILRTIKTSNKTVQILNESKCFPSEANGSTAVALPLSGMWAVIMLSCYSLPTHLIYGPTEIFNNS